MLTVYLLLRHPPSPFNHKLHIAAAEVIDVYFDRSEPDRIAEEKNKAKTSFLWSVKAKRAKGLSAQAPAPAFSTAQKVFPDGAWIADFSNPSCPRIGRVKDSYFMNGEKLVDVIRYTHKGKRIGRESPAGGGPRGFEPACAAEHWKLIKAPNFKLLEDINTTWGDLIHPLEQKQ